jgi:cold shock CspA family protein
MNFKNKEIIFKRFNSAAYDLALAIIAQRNSNNELYIKHKRDAGEAISQSLEYALKYHLNINLSFQDKKFFNLSKQDIIRLIEKYIDENGYDNGYLYSTVNNTTEPSVDFKFLRQNKNAITNAAKHEGREPDFETQKKYFSEVRKFINEYIDEQEKLKTIADYEKIDLSTWDLLYSACDRFSVDDRNYILIIGPNQNVDKSYLRNLAIPKWNLIIDFDYNSESNGFFDCAFKQNEVSPHKIKASDLIDVNSFSRFSQSHYHYFANNFKGSGDTEPKDYSEWNRKLGKNTEIFLRSFSEVFSNQKNIVVVLFNSRRHINFLCEKIEQYLGTNTSFVIANDFNDELSQVSNDFNSVKVNISISEIAEGLSNVSSNFGIVNPNKGQILIPFMEKTATETTGVLTASEFAQLEEYFEVLHKGLPNSNENEDDKRTFLTGEKKISWFGLKNRFDVERQNFSKKYLKPIEKVIENGRGKIQLVHEAGFGGTTVSRRIAWEIHNDYPTLILKKYRDLKIKESLIMLHEKTRKTIFVIMEVPQAITTDEVDSLYRSIPQARPIVFLVVKRGKSNSNELTVSDWGNNSVDLVNAYKPYLSEYSNDTIQTKKEKELNDILLSSDSYKKTPFYVGLLTFEEKFFALKDYIKNFVTEIQGKEEQKRALIYLAICDDYLGQGLPSSFFKTLFKASNTEIISIENYFSQGSSIVDSLLSSSQEGNHRFWKIRHNFFSKELKRQILSGNSDNPEIWRQGIADICVKFIQDSTSDANTSEYIQEVLQKLFIGNRKDRAGEDFTAIINDIDSIDGKEQVFLALKETYPDNPHYCSHLARFYAYHNKNREKALQYADEAIRLSEIEGVKDALLYHIKGMCLRSIAYDEMTKHRRTKLQNGTFIEEEYYEVIDEFVPRAAREFELSREIAYKQNRLDEHGFIAHIQLLVTAIDYAIVMSGKTKIDFFNQNIEPFADWLDLAESLLEEVKRINLDDDSGRIEECVNDIMAFYENYEQILQNLRNQLDKGKNPSRTRRQIVRTYFRKKEDYTKDIKTVNNILSLMEQNIVNEPDNEKNFYLWFQAARYSKISLEDALSKLSKWKANSTSIDAIYYFYILKVFRALQGYTDETINAFNLIKECKAKGKSNITILEWYGKGSDLTKFVSRNSVGTETKEEKLELVQGYFTEYLHDGSGKITIADKLEVFFSPTQAKLTSSDLNKKVEFYLGFSYDGLRADSYSVRLKGFEPRNTEPIEDRKEVIVKSSPMVKKQFAEKIQEPKVLGKISLPENKKSEVGINSKRQTGKVVDLQKTPVYTMGWIESNFGKRFFFHKDNEKEEVFLQLKIGSKVSFEITKTERGSLALNIELIKD